MQFTVFLSYLEEIFHLQPFGPMLHEHDRQWRVARTLSEKPRISRIRARMCHRSIATRSWPEPSRPPSRAAEAQRPHGGHFRLRVRLAHQAGSRGEQPCEPRGASVQPYPRTLLLNLLEARVHVTSELGQIAHKLLDLLPQMATGWAKYLQHKLDDIRIQNGSFIGAGPQTMVRGVLRWTRAMAKRSVRWTTWAGQTPYRA